MFHVHFVLVPCVFGNFPCYVVGWFPSSVSTDLRVSFSKVLVLDSLSYMFRFHFVFSLGFDSFGFWISFHVFGLLSSC